MKNKFEEIKAVLTDHDDTLVATIEPKWAQHRYVARTHYGIDLTDDVLQANWGAPLNELVRTLYRTEDDQQALAHLAASDHEFPKTLFPGTIPALQRIKEQGKLVGVVSASSRRSLERDLRRLDFPAQSFGYTQTYEDTSNHKPDPRVFEPALGWLAAHDIAPHETLYIGDSLRDMYAARGAGLAFVGVQTGLTTSEEFLLAGAWSVATFAEAV